MFVLSQPVRFEVEVRVGQPLDSTARQFLDSVMRSANKVLRYRADEERMVLTVEAHAIDKADAVPAAQREVARMVASTSSPRMRSRSGRCISRLRVWTRSKDSTGNGVAARSAS
jgi:hypothetical protein